MVKMSRQELIRKKIVGYMYRDSMETVSEGLLIHLGIEQVLAATDP